MNVKGFILQNEEKVSRAQKVAGENEDQLLVEYDKLGGLILKDGQKVKTGCFYDFEKKAAVDKPKLVFESGYVPPEAVVAKARGKKLKGKK